VRPASQPAPDATDARRPRTEQSFASTASGYPASVTFDADGEPGAGSPIIEASGLTKEFDAGPVVNDLDLRIERGMIVGLIGPSGCGKTTTVRMLAGLLTPTSGEALIWGRRAAGLSASERSKIGYMPQMPALFPDLSVWENLSFHASMYGLPLRRRALLRSLLDWVELTDDRRKRVRDVSGGMKGRLALAAAFVHDPSCIFLDEPTAGIDPILREKFWREFRAFSDDGRTLLVTTQYVGEASYCDLVGLMSDGELLMLDTPANLRRAAFNGEVVDVTFSRPPSEEEVAGFARLPSVIGSIERRGYDGLRIVVDDADVAIPALRDHVATGGPEIVEADEYTVDYDEAFVRVVERHRSSRGGGTDTADVSGGGVDVDTGVDQGEADPSALPAPTAEGESRVGA
jgi:ABC-2 type transport system ATP-binding protein